MSDQNNNFDQPAGGGNFGQPAGGGAPNQPAPSQNQQQQQQPQPSQQQGQFPPAHQNYGQPGYPAAQTPQPHGGPVRMDTPGYADAPLAPPGMQSPAGDRTGYSEQDLDIDIDKQLYRFRFQVTEYVDYFIMFAVLGILISVGLYYFAEKVVKPDHVKVLEENAAAKKFLVASIQAEGLDLSAIKNPEEQDLLRKASDNFLWRLLSGASDVWMVEKSTEVTETTPDGEAKSTTVERFKTDGAGGGWWYKAGLYFIIAFWAYAFLKLLYNRFALRYTISTQRIQINRGVLFIYRDNISFHDVRDVNMQSNFIDRMFGTGKIILYTSDPGQKAATDADRSVELKIEGVPNITEVFDTLQRVRSKYDHRYRRHVFHS
ncbi:MAG: PH domain-containing protein [Planctomycetes bacterium]|nr:PH domain-containing protein [Planctomycetota bacterium]